MSDDRSPCPLRYAAHRVLACRRLGICDARDDQDTHTTREIQSADPSEALLGHPRFRFWGWSPPPPPPYPCLVYPAPFIIHLFFTGRSGFHRRRGVSWRPQGCARGPLIDDDAAVRVSRRLAPAQSGVAVCGIPLSRRGNRQRQEIAGRAEMGWNVP